MQHNWHLQDIKGDHINEERKLNKVSLRRWDGSMKRGYCIVTHRPFHGRHSIPLHCPYTRPQATTWERACNGTIESPADNASSVPPGGAASEAGSGCYEGKSKKFSPKKKLKTPLQKASSQVSTASDGAAFSATCSDIPAPMNAGEGAEVLQLPPSAEIPAPRRFNEPKRRSKDDSSSLGSRSRDEKNDSLQSKIVKKNVTVTSAHGSEIRSESAARVRRHAEQHTKHHVPRLPMPRPPTPGYVPPPPPSVPGSDPGSVYSRPIV